MTAAVLSIGTELTRGELINSNAAWLGDQLTALGLEVGTHLTVGDDPGHIGGVLRRTASEARVIVATGGLGPTSDDLTARSVAEALGVELVRDQASLEHIRRLYASRGRTLAGQSEKQADFPAGASILPNPIGTAPGFAVDAFGARAFFLPGVPREMKAMFREAVMKHVARLGTATTHQVHLRLFGLPESEVGDRLQGLETDGVTLGYRAHFPEIEVKVHARAGSAGAAEEKAREVARVARGRLGDAVYGDRDDTYPGVVGQDLRKAGMTLAVAESCTGGMVGAMLTSVPGSSDYLLLDAVTYSNASKTSVLGVNPDVLRAYGAVSSESASSMAEGARRLADADVAVSITGIAGPGGGSDEKPVGTVWLGLAQRGRPTMTSHHFFHGDRERIRTRAAYTALAMVRRATHGGANGDPAGSPRLAPRPGA